MNEPSSTDNYVQIGDKVINKTIDASVTTDDVQLSDRVFVFKKNDDGTIKTVVNTTIQHVVDAFGADAVATKNEVLVLKNDVITLKSETNTLKEQASESADTASAKATAASTSASNASASATLASTKATEASASASTASTKASEASASATKASASEANAKTSETNAKTSETNASAKATEAGTSASNASVSEANAETYKTEAESARDKALQYRDEAEQLSQSLCYFRKQSYAVSASAGDTDITIPSEAQYRPLADILFVHNKGVFLKEDTDYTKSDTGITLATALTADTTIEFDVLRAVSTESQSYDLLKGDKGDKGTSITSVVQTTTSTEDDGNNIVTVTLSDNTASEFTIKNGSKGSKGDKGDKGAAYTITELLDLIYPVGAIYTSLEDVSPAGTLGGTWAKLPASYTLWTQSGTSDLKDSNNNPITISAGLPNLKGTFSGFDVQLNFGPYSGVFANATNGGAISQSSNMFGLVSTSRWGTFSKLNNLFDASAYNTIYSDSVKTVQPPAIRVYMWQRTK